MQFCVIGHRNIQLNQHIHLEKSNFFNLIKILPLEIKTESIRKRLMLSFPLSQNGSNNDDDWIVTKITCTWIVLVFFFAQITLWKRIQERLIYRKQRLLNENWKTLKTLINTCCATAVRSSSALKSKILLTIEANETLITNGYQRTVPEKWTFDTKKFMRFVLSHEERLRFYCKICATSKMCLSQTVISHHWRDSCH